MRLIAIGLCLIGCGCLVYQTLVFPRRLDSAIEEQMFLVRRYAVRLTPEQAVTLFRDLRPKIDSFRPTMWPGVVLVLIGSALLSCRSLMKRGVPEASERAEPRSSEWREGASWARQSSSNAVGPAPLS
jgi:hypothetical protein